METDKTIAFSDVFLRIHVAQNWGYIYKTNKWQRMKAGNLKIINLIEL